MRASTVLIAAACVLALLVFCPQVRATEVSLWNFVHPDAGFIAGFDWQRARTSAGGKMFAKQMAAQGAQFKTSDPAWKLVDRFDRIVVSSTGRPGAEPGAQPPVVVALEGRIDRAEFKKVMPPGTAVERFKGADLFVPPRSKGSEMLTAVVNERFALLGDRDSLSKVLEARSGARDTTLVDRAVQLAAACEIWVVSSVPPSQAAGGSVPGMKQFDDVESLDFGITLQKGLGLRANLITKSEDSARGLASLAQLLSSMAAQETKQAPEMTAVLKSLTIKTEGTAVRVAMDVPLSQLERGFTQMKTVAEQAGKRTLESMLGIGPASGMPAGLRPASSGVPAAAAAPAAPAVPEKRTIKIVGLEDGPREITYTTGGKKN